MLPSTFRGDRGGPAEDAELLAELRAISAKSSSAARFADSADEERTDAPAVVDHTLPIKRNVAASWRNASQPTTIAQSTRSSQKLIDFAGPDGDSLTAPHPLVDPDNDGVNSSASAGVGDSSLKTTMNLSIPSVGPIGNSNVQSNDNASDVTRESLSSSITDKNWKIRKQSFDLLCRLLSELVYGNEGVGEVDANSILNGLDSLIPGMLNDNNATALDSALQFGLLYADNCCGATSPERAAAIATALTKGPAFAATRPSTVKLCSSLVLKLMEVGRDGALSVHSVVEVLLTHGLTSRKPKVVLTASSLILDAAYAFGAANLPLAAVSSSAASILANSNAKVRENGMKVLAEICRALGSKDPLMDVIANMKSAQTSLLDSMLENQPEPTPIGTVLRSAKGGGVVSASDALAALQAGTKELEARRYAARPDINLIDELPKTDFNSQIKQQKWSEKVAALEIVLSAAGEKPYKLKQPSSMVNYGPLISEMKKLATHTHFAVGAKSMQVLSMLAEGVGEKLYPQLRPLLTHLLELSKDKKRTQAVASCLDSFFGNVLGFEHILEEEDAIPSSLDERKQKNALVRVTSLDFLNRCVNRNANAGPRGQINQAAAGKIALLSTSKLNDSDAAVRKSALELLRSLQSVEVTSVKESIAIFVNELKVSNPKVYKLVGGSNPAPEPSSQAHPIQSTVTHQTAGTTNTAVSVGSKSSSAVSGVLVKAIGTTKSESTLASGGDLAASSQISERDGNPALDDALDALSTLKIPSWDEPEDEGGILAGLKSSKWLTRQNAIKALVAFTKSDGIQSSVKAAASSLLVVVKENTRGFKETNVNVTKAIMELFIALGDIHESASQPFPEWAAEEAVVLAVDKIADKKLSSLSKALLTLMCVVHPPSSVLKVASRQIEKTKSPSPHEELLTWTKYFLTQFGATSIRSAVKSLVPWLLQEGQGSNVKVKKAAMSVIGELHSQSGPIFQAIALSLCKESALQSSLEATFSAHPYDASSSKAEWPKRCVGLAASNSGPATSNEMSSSFEIPKTDLVSVLPPDWPSKICSKEGKTAWKSRKEALDDLEKAIITCNGLLDTSNLKPIVELLRSLRDRLSDSQSNLKPLAVRLIGSILAKSDKGAQAKLGKFIYPAIINSALNDNKKQMRDAALLALRAGTTVSELEGGGPNGPALEFFVAALVSGLSGSEYKASGIPELLLFAVENVAFLPNLDDSNAGGGGQSLGEKFAAVVVECLTSSKSETRSAAEELLNHSLKKSVINLKNVTKGAGRLKPAQQRALGATIAKLENSVASSNDGGKGSGLSDCSKVDRGALLPISSSRPLQNRDASPERLKTNGSEPTTTISAKTNSLSTNRDPFHPLMGNMSSGVVKKARASTRILNWPEYPEEPTSSTFWGGLKKAWAPLLPATSVDVLFPISGIKKQDDGKDGCNLLSRAIAIERSGEGEALIEQLEFVLKWLTFVLCSRESTVGQQALLSLLLELFEYVKLCKYDLSDGDAAAIVPYLYEKASFAKGRFRDQFMEIIALLESEEVLQAKRLGPTVCVPLMERSLHSKTRVMGYQACLLCVDRIGLSGIGKKGVLVAAKCLSEESLPENRAAALELLNSILTRMNGDVGRLSKICGANLSEKARNMLEVFQRKRDGKHLGTTPNDVSRHSSIPTPSTSRRLFSQEGVDEETTSKTSASDFRLSDQLPALQLRYGINDPTRNSSTPTANRNSENPFTFSLNVGDRSFSTTTTYPDQNPVNIGVHPHTTKPELEEASGAAASLRARLLKLREKNKLPEPTTKKTEAAFQLTGAEVKQSEILAHDIGSRDEFKIATETINVLLESPIPVADGDPKLAACENCLKIFHAALSGEPNLDVELTEAQLESIKVSIETNTNIIVELLSRVIKFTFICGSETLNAGISVSLLFVCLATLMSLFRGSDFAKNVAHDSLTILIMEAGNALLDPRLASSSQQQHRNLDEVTSSQLVRAINKLAIQAATGAPRHIAFQSLMTLLQQLTLQTSDSTASGRLSRVVAKLFARLVKAESNCSTPFASGSVEMDALVLSLAKFLDACENSDSSNEDGLANCRLMAKSLVEAIMNARGGGSYIRKLMGELNLDLDHSSLAALVSSCETSVNTNSVCKQGVEQMSSSTSKDVASLVSAIGSAQEGPERRSAVDALRRYKAVHGDEELNAHLQEVSATFRRYVVAQLTEDLATSKPLVESSGMSERLQHLRSKLNAAEASVLSAVQPGTAMSAEFDPPPQSVPSITSSLSSSPSTKSPPRILLSAPSGKAPASDSTSKISASSLSSVQSLRERLAAAQESRLRIAGGTGSVSGASTSAMGHAAALRARLEAVKRQNNPS